MKNIKKTIFLVILFTFLLSNIAFSDDEFPIDENNDLLFENFSVSSTSTSEPVTYSKNIIVIDRLSSSILYEKNAYSKVSMASTTKIMTCIIVLENSSLNDIVTVSKTASKVTGSKLGLKENMRVSVKDLLYGLMLCSGNDCAIALAEYVSGNIQDFAFLMNKKKDELNLLNTNFITPHGLDDDNHYTSAYDLAILTNYALNNDTFRKIVSTKTYTISLDSYTKQISNTNELLGRIDGIYGVKTGFTFNAGRCLVSCCKRKDLDIIAVVLGADTKKIRTKDSINLINYCFNVYEYIDISNLINESFENYLKHFYNGIFLEKTIDKPVISLGELDNYIFPLETNGNLKLSTKVYILNKFSPKLKKGSKIGTFYIYNNDNLLCSTDIFLENNLTKNNWKYYYKNILKFFTQ